MDEPSGETPFLDWLPKGVLKRAGASLADLSGEAIQSTEPKSYVVATVELAWAMPISKLTCEHVRLLTSQKLGLQWLARAIAEFVDRYPAAEISFFRGDFTLSALRALPEIAQHDPGAARLLAGIDIDVLSERFPLDRSLMREAAALIREGRTELG